MVSDPDALQRLFQRFVPDAVDMRPRFPTVQLRLPIDGSAKPTEPSQASQQGLDAARTVTRVPLVTPYSRELGGSENALREGGSRTAGVTSVSGVTDPAPGHLPEAGQSESAVDRSKPHNGGGSP